MKPEPVPKLVVCSVCGLDWTKHPEKPLLDDCIALLKAELAAARRPTYLSSGPNTYTNFTGGGQVWQ